MANDLYSRMAKTAERLLSPTSEGGLGQGVVELIHKSPGAAPIDEWDIVELVTTTETLKAAVRGVDKRMVGVEVGGTVILSSDRQVICATPKIFYSPNDTLVVDGKPVTILSVEKLPAAGITVAVKFIIRG